MQTKEQWRAKNVALHRGLSWTACYDDQCPVHLDAKQRHEWFPKKLSKKGKEPARDMDWETSYDAEPGSDWAPPLPAKKERRLHKNLVKWQHCFRDNCSVHQWEKADAGYYPRCNLLLSIARFPEGDPAILWGQGGEASIDRKSVV